jgi:nucleolar GTP-binding protein
MVVYNFKTIAVVPSGKQFIDIILSKTQRKTPTVIHNGYAIPRIRKFYMRKIKYTQENFVEKITLILQDFPRLDDIHPFYADLINVLYSRDHYKLALAQCNGARSLIENIGKEYLKLIKFADSLYRCKTLKRAALGRMCAIVLNVNASLLYLEQVRQHLSRLPSIDPSSRTLLITGFPNVGKSSYLNAISQANVEVQPYAFTTKSLFVGHFDYKYVRFQCIDSPGILDHPLEERNTIEMQSITALAHLNSAILYFIDISEQCGYSLAQQCHLFETLLPLFANKPVLVVANKSDTKRYADCDATDKALIDKMLAIRPNVQMLEMSAMTQDNIDLVKNTACDILLAQRVEKKLKTKGKVNDIANRIHVTFPTKRDEKERPLCIPEGVLQKRLAKKSRMEIVSTDDIKGTVAEEEPKRKTLKDIELEHGGPGIFNINLRQHYQLDNPEWANDVIPEFMDGKNVADFYDPHIMERLEELEREEDALIAQWEASKNPDVNDMDDSDDEDLTAEQLEMVQKIRDNKKLLAAESRLRDKKIIMPRTARSRAISVADAAETMEEMGVRSDLFTSRARSKSRTRTMDIESGASMETSSSTANSQKRGRKRTRDNDDADETMEPRSQSKSGRSVSNAQRVTPRNRSASHVRTDLTPFRNPAQEQQAKKLRDVSQRPIRMVARGGEGDHRIFDLKPKHLFSGKRSIGKNDRR